jgi:SulP family sulfate permease
VIVTIMLIPQSLAYALLAGLPPETGHLRLDRADHPLRDLRHQPGTGGRAGGGGLADDRRRVGRRSRRSGSPDYARGRAITLAFLSGVFLIWPWVLRLGFLANFLSHPVIAGFITASGIIIAASQLKHILGIRRPVTTCMNFWCR